MTSQTSEPAPILLFTYKRLDTLKETVAALQKNKLAPESELFIFSDAAKHDKDKPLINEIRSFLHTITGFKTVHITEAEKNKGLATSIISGVTKVLQTHDTVIVLEDDLKTTPNFLLFMNEGLRKYKEQEKVFSISGYSFNLGIKENEKDDAYFLNRGWSWGWATWKNRWEKVDWEVKDYASFLADSKAQKEFAKGGSDLNKMLASQMSGKLDSWAIRWFYHQFKIKGLTLYPVFSKIYNEGFDENATHTTGSANRYIPVLDKENKTSFQLPLEIKETAFYQAQFQKKMGIAARIKSKLETIFKKLVS